MIDISIVIIFLPNPNIVVKHHEPYNTIQEIIWLINKIVHLRLMEKASIKNLKMGLPPPPSIWNWALLFVFDHILPFKYI